MNDLKNHSVSNPLVQYYDVKAITSLGFTLIIAILLMSIIGSFHISSSHNKSLVRLGQESSNKTLAAFTMREAIRERIDGLNNLSLQTDIFDLDQQKMRFSEHASKYTRARQLLISQINSDAERRIFDELDATARTAGYPNAWALDALFDETTPPREVQRAVQASVEDHLSLLRKLDEMARTIHRTTQTEVGAAGKDFNDALLLIVGVGIPAFVIAVITATFVVIRAGERNRQVTHQAAHDVLTDLLNRQAFEASLKLTLEQCLLSPENHALLFVDLDRFKVVNDTAGHLAGDALLKDLSQKLSECLRHSDVLARIGGDEFGVLLRYVDAEAALTVAEKLRQGIESFSFTWEKETFKVGASIGMVPFGQEPASIEQLMGNADACCYSAKEEGRNRVHVADVNVDTLKQRSGESRWITRINDAIANDRFVLYGQMIKPLNPALDDGRLVIEVLLRMIDPKGNGLISPGQFLPAAERYGIVPEIDRWVVRRALAWLAELGGMAQHLRININICGPSASDPKFHEYVRSCINEYGVPPQSLCFELTESTAISSMANAQALINALGDLGCTFALDDFGSGLSSFNQLRHLAVDYLKIDGSFIENIDRDDVNRAMVESINTIGKLLGKRTVAEFVTNERVRKILQQMDVDYAQGFALHKPEPLRQIQQGMLASQTDLQGPNVA